MKNAKLSLYDQFPALKQIPEEKFPKHILIIPDGNGRWAKEHNIFVTAGHKKGAEVVEKILDDISQIQAIKAVTLWGFAADNWKRSTDEVKGLMFLLKYKIKNTIKKLKARNGRFIHLGRKDRMPQDLREILEREENNTKKNTGQILSLAIDFGGEDQNIRMIQQARQIPSNIPISQDVLWQLRDGHGIVKSADLLIRTSGEKRTSDIGWLNGVSTELYFIEKFFPDITIEDIVDAIIDYAKRERRFGGRVNNPRG